MCSVVPLQALNGVQMTSTMTTTMTASYSTFSIASLIGHQQISDDDGTLVSGISATETAMRDDHNEDSIATSQRETTTTTSLPADAGVSAANDANRNCGGLHAPATRFKVITSVFKMKELL